MSYPHVGCALVRKADRQGEPPVSRRQLATKFSRKHGCWVALSHSTTSTSSAKIATQSKRARLCRLPCPPIRPKMTSASADGRPGKGTCRDASLASAGPWRSSLRRPVGSILYFKSSGTSSARSCSESRLRARRRGFLASWPQRLRSLRQSACISQHRSRHEMDLPMRGGRCGTPKSPRLPMVRWPDPIG